MKLPTIGMIVNPETRLVAALLRFVPIYFEFLKRVALVAVLKAASGRSAVMMVLYSVGIFFLVLPVYRWLDSRSFTLKIDGVMSDRDHKIVRVAWAVLVGSVSVGFYLILNLVITTAVQQLKH